MPTGKGRPAGIAEAIIAVHFRCSILRLRRANSRRDSWLASTPATATEFRAQAHDQVW